MKNSSIRIAFILAFLLCDLAVTNAQTVLWAKKGSSEGFDNGNAIVTDDSGNVYVTGQYEFSCVFDNYTLNSYGQHDIFVAKYDSYGSIKWIRKAGGPLGDIGNAIGIDAAHNVYVTGEFEDTAVFGPHEKCISTGGNDGFLAKYDVDGNIVWTKDFGSPPGSDKGRALAVSPSGDVYITGNFSASTSFGGNTLTSTGSNDIFIVKYLTDGSVDWAKRAGGTGQDRGYGLVIDADENVYVCGTFTQSATFKNTTITNPSNNATFLAKYNSNGSFQWVRDAGACCDTTKANSLALDENGNIYLCGYFKTDTKFGSTDFTSNGISDVFLVKYDPTGDVKWARQAGGPGEDGAYGMCIDTSNHIIYMTGLTWESGAFDTCQYTKRGFIDAFITAYNMDGRALWVKIHGGHLRDAGAAVAVDSKGYIYSTGLFNDIADFGGITLTGYPDQPWADFYVDKILPPMATAVTNQATDLSVTSGHCSDLKISLTPGSGSRRIIVAREGAAVNSFPLNGNDYSANNVFGNGSNLGNGNYVMYNGSGNGVTVSGLTAGTTYYFSVFEFNGAGVSANYLTNPLTSVSAMAPIFPITVTGLQNSICAGDSLNLVATEAVNFDWSPIAGLSAGTGSAVTAKPLSTTTYVVTGTTADGCDAHTEFTIVVNPLPSVNLSTISPLCENSVSMTLSNGNPSGGIYSGTGVSNGMFDPAATGTGTFTLQYVYTDANGCISNSQTDIVVNSAPVITMTPLPEFCRNGAPVTLNCASPAGGTYSGTGVNAGVFNPMTGVGTYTINYSYTDINGCTAHSSVLTTVEPLPVVNLGNDRVVCANESTIINAGGGFSSYSWSTGATTQSIVFDSSGTGLGVNHIYVIVSNAAGCKSSSTIQITFDICAGINNSIVDFHDVMIYPNPFRNSFTLSSDKPVSFSIYDMCGRMLDKKENVSGSILAGENFSRGVYFVEVISGLNKKIFSVVKTE